MALNINYPLKGRCSEERGPIFHLYLVLSKSKRQTLLFRKDRVHPHISYQRNILYMSIAAKTELRLVNGPTSHEGRVEVKNNGIWGTICCNGFVVQSADVIYKSLGLKGYVVVFNLPLNEYVRLYSQCLSNHVHRLWTNMSDCTHSIRVTMFTAFERVCQTVLTVSE